MAVMPTRVSELVDTFDRHIEAKKPSVDIKGDPHPAYQLRRYAWSAKLPISILTDFEELAAAKIPDDKTRIQRQINTTDKQIDNIVYDLYGLTEEEVKIIEKT
jgi:hypothetical protein